jgi:hypothetical protein
MNPTPVPTAPEFDAAPDFFEQQDVYTQTVRASNPVRQRLLNLEPPRATRTYAPVSNRNLYQQAIEAIDAEGLHVIDELWTSAFKDQVMTCRLIIQTPNSDICRTLAFGNSYNKMRSVQFAAGATVMACANGIFMGDVSTFKRRHHHGNYDRINHAAEYQVSNLVREFERIKQLQEKLQDRMLTIEGAAAIGGVIAKRGILTPHMLADYFRELDMSYNFAFHDNKGTAWMAYNNMTQALKRSNGFNIISKHQQLTEAMQELVN